MGGLKTIWRGTLLAASLVGTAVLIVLSRHREPPPPGTSPSVPEAPAASASAPEVAVRGIATNRPGRPRRTYSFGRGHISEAELAELKATFESKLKPEVVRWCKAYRGHIPFQPEAFTTDTFSSAIGRGPFCMYIFVLDSMTVAVEESGRGVLFSHLNTPASKKLVQLPHGTPTDPSMPVTREEIARMLKADSGIEFPPAEIRITPTAFSSAMSGGAQVTVGGDPINIASWKFNLVFGPDGNLTYYLRGR